MYKKLSYKQYEEIKGYTRTQLSVFIQKIYESGYNDGQEKGMDWELVKIAIKSTHGVGKKLFGRIVERVERMCLDDKQ